MIYHLDGSGGGTKGEAIKTVWDTAVYKEGFKPDVISGNSVMALIQVAFALGIHNKDIREKLDILLASFTLDTIWRISPIGKNGGVTARAVFRGVTGKSGLGEMSIDSVLSELIPEDTFRLYQKNDKYADCINVSVDFKTGSRVIKSMKEVSYKEFLLYSKASASIPVFSEPVCIDGKILFDGGVRDHSIGAEVMKRYSPNETVSVFSRPANYNITDNEWEAKNVLEVLFRTIDIMNMEISKNDEFEQIKISKEKNIKLTQVFLPKIMKSPYDTNRDRLNDLKEAATNIKLKL